MSSKQWDEAELAKTSAELDAELEEIFAEVDRVGRSPEPEAAPRKAAVPRDGSGDEPPEIEILPDNFEEDDPDDEPVGDFGHISPASDNEVFDADFTVEAENRRTAAAAPSPEREDDGDQELFPGDRYDGRRAASVGEMSPEEFGRLVERAVERAILSAIAKAGL